MSAEEIGCKPVVKLEDWNVIGSQATGTPSGHPREKLNGRWMTTSDIVGLDREKRMIETRNTCYELGAFENHKDNPEKAVREETLAFEYVERMLARRKTGYDANTLYVIGTNAKGEPSIRSTRTSFDAGKDYHIMSSALELSQAVELRGVDFGEHTIGSLIVRPVTSGRDRASTLDDNEANAITLWAEIHRLRAMIKGPPGFDTWQDAATDERLKRAAAEAKLRENNDVPASWTDLSQ